MQADPEGELAKELAKLIPGDKLYDDMLAQPAKNIGKALTTLIKAGHLVLLGPLQYLAAQQDRYERFLKRVVDKVDKMDRIPVHPEIGGPSLEALRYMDESSPATEMMLNLLACAMDKRRVGNAHPAFPNIVRQLTPDECLVLFLLKKRHYTMHRAIELYTENPAKVEDNDFPISDLAAAEHFYTYMDHLHHLGVATTLQHGRQEPLYDTTTLKQNAVRIEYHIKLTPLGDMFARACVPDAMPERKPVPPQPEDEAGPVNLRP